jgi:hypothetical protein
VALVAGHVITRAMFRTYVTYTARFYTSVHPGLRTRDCLRESQSTICKVLARQVLTRLIEEQVILGYANRHHIGLSSQNLTDIQNEMVGSGIATASSAGASKRFINGVLRREMLVREVEETVAPPTATSGISFHLRRFALPFSLFGGPRNARRVAVLLSTAGAPVPSRAQVRVEWIAPFRLLPAERNTLELAKAGEFTGPFRFHRAFIVLQMLARAGHPYGRAAEQQRSRSRFGRWLRLKVRQASPRCFGPAGNPLRCPIG